MRLAGTSGSDPPESQGSFGQFITDPRSTLNSIRKVNGLFTPADVALVRLKISMYFVKFQGQDYWLLTVCLRWQLVALQECGSKLMKLEWNKGRSPLPSGTLSTVACIVCDEIVQPLCVVKHGRAFLARRGGGRGRGRGRRGRGRGRGRKPGEDPKMSFRDFWLQFKCVNLICISVLGRLLYTTGRNTNTRQTCESVSAVATNCVQEACSCFSATICHLYIYSTDTPSDHLLAVLTMHADLAWNIPVLGKADRKHLVPEGCLTCIDRLLHSLRL